MKSLLDSIWAPEEDNNEIVIQKINYYCISIDCGGGDGGFNPPANFTCLVGGGHTDYVMANFC